MSACRCCRKARATIGLVHPCFDYLIVLCHTCYTKEVSRL